MQDPLISVIIPNYNHSQFLEASILSALNQTYPAFEIIVVDDGSTDNCRQVVASFGERVRYIYQQNQGLAGARNTGIREAKGEFIGLLDADDQWKPNYLENMINMQIKHSNAVAFYCQSQCMDENGKDLPQILGGPPVPTRELYWKLLRANFIIPSTILIRRESIYEVNLFDPSLRSCEDWDLWLRLLPAHEIIGTLECLVRYRIHQTSLSANVEHMQQAVQSVIEKHFGTIDGLPGTWSAEKRRASGGVYRYHLLTSVLRQYNWEAGAEYLKQALVVDPTLSLDVDLFYELALGSQPPGYRGTDLHLNLDENSFQLLRMIHAVFAPSAPQELICIRKKTYGTAYFALGLLAYNIGESSMSRIFIGQALYHRPDLRRNSLAVGNFVKSLLPKTMVERAKSYLRRI